MSDVPPLKPPAGRASLAPWLRVAGYFVVFFAAMALGGVLFLLGGITIVLIPGSLPIWAEVSYILLGIVGSVTIALVAANGAFRVTAHPGAGSGLATGAGPARAPRLLAWVAGVAGTVLASVLSAVLGAVILNWLDR